MMIHREELHKWGWQSFMYQPSGRDCSKLGTSGPVQSLAQDNHGFGPRMKTTCRGRFLAMIPRTSSFFACGKHPQVTD